jgi:hypothetical protein
VFILETCAECVERRAECRCHQCEVLYCAHCFTKVRKKHLLVCCVRVDQRFGFADCPRDLFAYLSNARYYVVVRVKLCDAAGLSISD